MTVYGTLTQYVYVNGTTVKYSSFKFNSEPSYNGAVIEAAACSTSWNYVKDNGTGDYVVSSW